MRGAAASCQPWLLCLQDTEAQGWQFSLFPAQNRHLKGCGGSGELCQPLDSSYECIDLQQLRGDSHPAQGSLGDRAGTQSSGLVSPGSVPGGTLAFLLQGHMLGEGLKTHQ